MARWLVITTEIATVIPVTDEGYGPLEYSRDVIEIEADSRRDAVALGVREMLRLGWTYVSDQRADGCSPYTGVRAERVEGR
jgi:hypothetical protein